MKIFENLTVSNIASVQEGLKTGDNDRFIRYWYEINVNDSNIYGDNQKKWIYHTKGGDFRKWYGNRCELLNYGVDLFEFKGSCLAGKQNYFLNSINYNRISSSQTSFRLSGNNSIPNMAGLAIYVGKPELMYYILGWLNTKIVKDILIVINPTLNFPPGLIGKIPLHINEECHSSINDLVEENINVSKEDWDSFETSWDFKKYPLI